MNYMLNRFRRIVEQLASFRHDEAQHGSVPLIYPQQVMLALADRDFPREEAYNIVQPLAMEAWEKQSPSCPSFWHLKWAIGLVRRRSRPALTTPSPQTLDLTPRLGWNSPKTVFLPPFCVECSRIWILEIRVRWIGTCMPFLRSFKAKQND